MEKEKKTSQIRQKIATGIAVFLCVILAPLLITNCILIIKSYSNQDTVPAIGGYFPMIVMTDSMYPEIQSGDLIICRSKKPENIAVGDIICFFDPGSSGKTTVTHRVTELTTDDSGGLAFVTKGDANNTEDPNLVPAANLIGVYKKRLPKVGDFALFLQTKSGFVICVLFPIILLVLYDVIRRRIYERKNQDEKAKLLAELEALKAKNKQDDNNSSDI